MGKYQTKNTTIIVDPLEPRILLDGAAVAEGVEMLDDLQQQSSNDAVPTFSISSLFENPATGLSGQQAERREITFIDKGIEGYQQLVDQATGAEIVLLDDSQNGLSAIASYLSGQQGVDAIHILSHGAEGRVTLGNMALTTDNVAENTAALQAIGNALSDNGDILLYGCDLSGNPKGVQFLEQLAEVTGADVAASDDKTGSALLGADWVLETRVGNIESESHDFASFDGVLAPSISGLDPSISFTEGDAAFIVDNDLTITGGGSYTEGFIRFSVGSSNSGDQFNLTSSVTPNASGAISVVGSDVYLGNGSGRDRIGSIDAVENGQNGQALKILFSSPLPNAGFEEGTANWTISNQRYGDSANEINLDGYNIGLANDTDYSGGTGTTNTQEPNSGGVNFTGSVADGQGVDNSKALYLSSSGNIVQGDQTPNSAGLGFQTDGYGSIHGPYATSSVISVQTGDSLSLDFRAVGSGDDYEVFGLLRRVDGSGNFINNTIGSDNIVLFAERGEDTGGYKTVTQNNLAEGDYRFEFVGGTYDGTGGYAVGSNLYVDNIRLVSSTTVNDSVATTIARQVSYQNTGTDSLDSRTMSIQAVDANAGSTVANTTLNITQLNNAPSFTGNATLGAVAEDVTDPSGASVSSLFGGLFSDPDASYTPADTLSGIVVTADNSSGAEGEWQYSTDSGTSWHSIGAVSDASGLVLNDTAQLRFVPVAEYSGTPGSLSVRAVDSTYSGSFTNGAGRVAYDTAVSGGNTSISAAAVALNTSVSAVNDDPSATGVPVGPITTLEDIAVDIDLSSLTLSDIDSDAAAISLKIVAASGALTASAIPGITVTGSGTGTLTVSGTESAINSYLDQTDRISYQPAQDQHGSVSLNLYANDNGNTGSGGGTDVLLGSVSVDITAVNDAPGFTAGADQTVNEDAGSQTVSNWATAISEGATNESAQNLHFTVSNDNPSLFSVAPAVDQNGNLTYTLADNAYGTATVTVRLNDDGGVADGGSNISSAQTFTITANAVNDAPAIGSGNNGLVYNEGSTIVLNPAISLSDLELAETDDYAGFSIQLARAAVSAGQLSANVEDSFNLDLDGSSISLVGDDLMVGGQKLADITVASGLLTITFANTGVASAALVNEVAQSIRYHNTNPSPAETEIRLRWLVNDGNSGTQGSGGAGVSTTETLLDVNHTPTDVGTGQGFEPADYTIAGGNSLVVVDSSASGGERFGTRTSISNSDDSYQQIDISAVFPDGVNFFGNQYDKLYIGTNGYITFGHSNSSYNPAGIAGYTQGPIIAAQFDDIHMGRSPGESAGGTSEGSNDLFYDVDTDSGVVTITWDDVGAYRDGNAYYGDPSVGNAFQIRLHKISETGDFAIEIRYENISWAGGYYQSYSTAGWSAGDRQNYGEVSVSGQSGFLDVEQESNIDQAGVFVWEVKGGQVSDAQSGVAENSVAGTVVGQLATADSDSGDSHTYSLVDDADGRFELFDNGGNIEIRVAADADLNFEDAEQHTIRVRSTDANGLFVERDIQIDLTDVDEAPTDISLSGDQKVTEGAASGTIIGQLTAVDPENDEVQFSVVGDAAAYFTVSGNRLVVKPGAVLDFEDISTHVVTIRATDAAGNSYDEAFNISIQDVNETPLFGGAIAPLNYTENDPASAIDPTITLADPDAASFDGGYLQVTLTQGADSSDLLSVIENSSIQLSGTDVLYRGEVIGRLNADANGQQGRALRIDLNDSADAEAVQSLARSIGYSSDSDNPTLSRQVNFTVSDGGGVDNVVQTAQKNTSINITRVNDAPVISAGSNVLHTERVAPDTDGHGDPIPDTGNPDADFYISGISVGDPDSSNLTVTLSTRNIDGNGDYYGTLTIATGVTGGLTAGQVSGNGTGEVTITGSVEQINATLAAAQGLQYVAEPGHDIVVDGVDLLTVTATDDQGITESFQKQVIVLPETPTAHSVNLQLQEDQTSVPVDLSNAILDVNGTPTAYVTGTGIAPTGSSAGTITNTFPTSGTVRLSNGELTIIDNTTGQFSYTPDADWSGVETFLYQYTSSAETTEVALVRIVVTAVNDAPVLTVPGAQNVLEDTPLEFSSAEGNEISLADVDAADGVLELSLAATNGTLSLATTNGLEIREGADGQASMTLRGSLLDLRAALDGLQYQGNQDFHGTDRITVSFSDRGFAGDGQIEKVTQSIDISIANVNDAPVYDGGLPDAELRGTAGKLEVWLQDTQPIDLFSDVDNDNVLSFSAEGLPNGLTIDSQTGQISGAPLEPGSYEVTIVATDSSDAAATAVIKFRIDPVPLDASTTPAPIGPINLSGPTLPQAPLPEAPVHELPSGDEIVDSNGLDAPVFTGEPASEVTPEPSEGLAGNAPGRDSPRSIPADSPLAVVDVNVGLDGTVRYDSDLQLAQDITGMAIAQIQYDSRSVQIDIIDSQPAETYSATLANGEPLPVWITVDPVTGQVTAIPPEESERIDIRIIAVDRDGKVRILQVGIEKPEEGRNAAADESGYRSLDQQLSDELALAEPYGQQVVSAMLQIGRTS